MSVSDSAHLGEPRGTSARGWGEVNGSFAILDTPASGFALHVLFHPFCHLWQTQLTFTEHLLSPRRWYCAGFISFSPPITRDRGSIIHFTDEETEGLSDLPKAHSC